jgi:hypothetical protein
MSTQKRTRACDNCHSIKIKCELGSAGGLEPPCERCVRLNKNCVVTPPKRQKDRVAELEAQVEALTRMLQAQGIDRPAPATTPDAGAAAADSSTSKKRRRNEHEQPTLQAVAFGSSSTFELDRLVPVQTQARILHKFVTEMLPAYPIMPPTGDWSLEVLRTTKPALLKAITYVGCPGMIPEDDQEEVARLLMDSTSNSTLATASRGVELVQLIQAAILWYWLPKHQRHLAVFQLTELAYGAALSAGLGQPGFLGVPDDSVASHTLDNAEAWRTWLLCHTMSASMALFLRQTRPHAWTQHHEECLTMLQYSPHGFPSDQLLCQYIRAERLCEQIAHEQKLYDLSAQMDICDAVVQSKMRMLQNRITDWDAQIPADIRSPTLTVVRQAAVLSLHEPVLHTINNKRSFAAPFIAEHLSVTDIPAPVVTPEHIASLWAIRHAAQSLIETFCTIEMSTIMALPGMLFPSRMMYSIFLLMKMYIATTASGNTYGSVIGPTDLRIEEMMQKVEDLGQQASESDNRKGFLIALTSIRRQKDWLNNYKNTLQEMNAAANNVWVTSGVNMEPLNNLEGIDWDMLFAAPADLDATFSIQQPLDDDFSEWNLSGMPFGPP